MNVSSVRPLLLALPFAGGLLAAPAATPLSDPPPLEGKPLASFSVAPEFTLTIRMPPPDAAIMPGPAIFTSADDQPRSATRNQIKYRSIGLRSGDEIVSINGHAFATLSPHAFWQAFARNVKTNLEVRQPGAKEIRHVTATPVWHPEDKFADDATLKQFAEFARPACIFNERGKLLFPAGAEKFIEAIAVDDRVSDSDDDLDQLPRRIVVRFKQPLTKEPLLMLADSYQAMITTERTSDRERIYTLEFSGERGSAQKKVCRFRLSI